MCVSEQRERVWCGSVCVVVCVCVCVCVCGVCACRIIFINSADAFKHFFRRNKSIKEAKETREELVIQGQILFRTAEHREMKGKRKHRIIIFVLFCS